MNDISYNDWNSLSDVAVIKMIGAFVKHHRLQQNRTQGEISSAAGISRSTLSLLERGETVTLTSLIQTLRSLNLLYIMDVFKVQETISPIELAKRDAQQRQRASNKGKSDIKESDW